MIFVTTGTQLPFPRLISAMNALAPDLAEEIIAQIGPDTAPYPNLSLHQSLKPSQFETFFTQARVVVAHAGIGSVLSAKAAGKPLIVLPRRFDQSEHRNDHQLATARQVEDVPGIHVAWEVEDLEPLLRAQYLIPASDTPGPTAQTLITRLKTFIDG